MRAPAPLAGRRGTCNQCQAEFRIPHPRVEQQVDTSSASAPTITPVFDKQSRQSAPHSPQSSFVRPFDSDDGFHALLDQVQQVASESVEQARRKQVASKLTAAQIAGSFSGKIEQPETSQAYKSSLLGVAVMMFMLPLSYLGLIFACAIAMLLYIFFVVPSLSSSMFAHGWIGIVMLLAIWAPVVAGAITLLFMVKPIFGGRGKRTQTRTITREEQPVLFALIDRVCEATGAPQPTRVEVDMNMNASASLGSGMFSFLSSDLVLAIGMPLLATLDARQFTGVLAHEFGHFSQGAGMRASLVVRTVNQWFAKLVYQRDAIDYLLESAVSESPTWIGILFALGKLFVLITRGILWLFMKVGQLVSSALLHQMEFDADQYEVRLVGAEVFKRTSRDLIRSSIGFEKALDQAGQWLPEQRLVDDLTVLTKHFTAKVTSEEMEQREQLEAIQAIQAVHSTHPTTADRIEQACAGGSPGVFHLAGPASALIHHFEPLCRIVTCEFYREALATDVQLAHLTATAEWLPKLQQA